MSEGPEVRRTADRLAEALLGRRVEAFESRRVRVLPPCAARIVGSRVMSIRAHGKQLVFRFSRRVYLRNHMLMWGKWRTYTRAAYESGSARPPPRVSWRRKRPDARPPPVAVDDVRLDARVRLVLLTDETAAVQFNGPIIEFTAQDPAIRGAIARLGPDPLDDDFPLAEAGKRFLQRARLKLADLLLDQTFVAGVGNKYKSEILFAQRLHPFLAAGSLRVPARRKLLTEIRRMLRYGYAHAGRTRPVGEDEPRNRWTYRHWVFRRGGQPCYRCGERILTDRRSSRRVTFWCPGCQPA